ncbi:MAG: NAD-glutamate dehydrogenase [Cellvibrionaceae bacterium]|nr:NAD-glutamate dehydrogenase [Cellvibrionaceae bacterium]
MELTAKLIHNPSQLKSQIEHVINKKDKISQPEYFFAFVQSYLSEFPLQEWLGRQVEDLCGFLHGVWQFSQVQPLHEPQVKVFNPNIEEHAWLCGRTVVLVHQRDMPFLVDSIRIEFNRREIPIHVIKSTVMNVRRVENQAAEFFPVSCECNTESDSTLSKEAIVYLEIALHSELAQLAEIQHSLLLVLKDVEHVIEAYEPTLQKLLDAAGNLASLGGNQSEVGDFLDWLTRSHFTFLGYREYDFVNRNGESVLQENSALRMGVFKKLEKAEQPIYKANFSQGMRDFHAKDERAVFFSKASTRSSVQRAVYPDYVVVKKYNAQGEVIGERRFLGLFTYAVYITSTWQIPILRHKVERLVRRSGWETNSHDGKSLRRIIENFPRDELFQTDFETLHRNMMTIAAINERHVVRLIMRPDPFGNFVNCLVYIPRDNFNTEVQHKIERLIGAALNTNQFDSTIYFSESTLVRLQIIYRVKSRGKIDYDVAELEARVLDISRTWVDKLRDAFVEAYGESVGTARFNKYKAAFSQGYQESFVARSAVHDLEMLERLDTNSALQMNMYQQEGAEKSCVRFKVMHLHNGLELSYVVPILENLGLRVQGEYPYQITKQDGTRVWLHDFTLILGQNVSLDVRAVRSLFEQAFESIWRGYAESDAFNYLVLGARLTWREVCLLRAYAAYMKQTGFHAEQSFIAETLATHTDITRNIVALFKAAFDPRLNKNDDRETADTNQSGRVVRLQQKILDGLDGIDNLNQDRVLRRYLELVNATLRTNYYQLEEAEPKSYISLKLNPLAIPGIPEPRPMFEVFVYSPRVEGVHLRGGKVARGGLRWSDRLQDYRTEILGLVKAQQVKNAVIVPTGAKGGFVCKQMASAAGPEAMMQEGIACYRLFIQGLLDVTDNLQQGKVVPPRDVVRRDDDDPYLVVAADKGTASFSDIANEISQQYQHWLGDAFASGGSQGYDHKGMAITARGAWVCVQRHFREKGIDIQRKDFSVIGIGDMSGDVFGNGMLLSKHIRLLAAFNHRHIFVDPNPDAAQSFVERTRLFKQKRTSWQDYDAALISRGGGVFQRSAKYIDISPEMQKAFAITESKLNPVEFISALLKSPVDLIWNGGIGTYVKASWESHADVGDKANDSLRVDGKELRCQVFGEGGNLGVTQLGRIEYCLNNGACNTDFIDNAGGVDCSDHEVNIKILLDDIIRNGDLTDKQRNQLLVSMTDTVADLVLDNNYRQSQAISIAAYDVQKKVAEYRRFIQHLESGGHLNRDLEFLPSDAQIKQRLAKGKSLTRPELSILISYAKMTLKEKLTNSDIAEDNYIINEISKAFPPQLLEQYPQEIYQHRLLKELIATQVANDMVHTLGITGYHRLLENTGASYAEMAKFYVVARDIFQVQEFMSYIASLDYEVSSEFQYELISNMVRRVRRGTRWFLRNRRQAVSAKSEVELFRSGLDRIYKATEGAFEGAVKQDWLDVAERYHRQGIPMSWALKLAIPTNLFSGLGIIEAAREANCDIDTVAKIYFELVSRLGLNSFATRLTEVQVDSYWQALARESYIDEVEFHLRRIVESLVTQAHSTEDCDEVIEAWLAANEIQVHRWLGMFKQVKSNPTADYAMFAVAIRELHDLSQAGAE